MVFDFDKEFNEYQRWFKKPAAMIEASKHAEFVCWLDTDCQVKENIEDIFGFVQPDKLTIGIDDPWTTRRQETWHNSGVVAFRGCPDVLIKWKDAIVEKTQNIDNPMYGDQDVLHEIVGQGFARMKYLNTLPKMFNTLRLDFLDNTVPPLVKVHHHTGKKGNDKIKEIMKGKENG